MNFDVLSDTGVFCIMYLYMSGRINSSDGKGKILMKLYDIVFSPTGGTQKVSDILCSVWEEDGRCKKEIIDLTDRKTDFSKYTLEKEDICFVSVPSFGGRVPDTAAERIAQIHGNKALAVAVIVYGNREYDDTLLELQDILETAGFRCAAAVTAVAEHSIMRQFAAGRPDRGDETQLKEFSKKIQAVFGKISQASSERKLQLPGNRPYREYNGVPFKPSGNEKCVSCGVCAQKCPVGAIPDENPAAVDPEVCISCMRCIAVCPVHARHIDEKMVEALAQKVGQAFSHVKENELFLI